MKSDAHHSACCLGISLAIAAMLAATVADARAVDPQRAPPASHPLQTVDAVAPMLRRIDRYLQSHEVNGVVLDPRVALNATEAARLSVVPQLLAYAELERVHPSARFRADIADRARFLSDRFDEFRSGSVFDGMLGYAFFEAYAATRDTEFLDRGTAIVQELEAISSSEYILNGGLMAAMAFARDFSLTGDPESGQLARQIVAGLPAYQHTDGSFPHWCVCSRDIHYTDWMATELILIGRFLDDPDIAPILDRMRAFLEGRIDARGRTVYEEPCDRCPGGVVYYYSIATGCTIDVDTRAFTNELGYSVLLLDHARSPQLPAVLKFLDSLEVGGTLADKWDFPLPPDDPYYPWTAADTSIVNTSLVMWSLASTLAERAGDVEWTDDAPPDSVGPPRHDPHRLPVQPSGRDRGLAARAARPDTLPGSNRAAYCDDATFPPTSPEGATAPGGPAALAIVAGIVSAEAVRDGGNWTIRFELSAPLRVRMDLVDVSGRRVRTLLAMPLDAGVHAVRWDNRDEATRRCPSGLYFVRLRAASDARDARVLRLLVR